MIELLLDGQLIKLVDIFIPVLLFFIFYQCRFMENKTTMLPSQKVGSISSFMDIQQTNSLRAVCCLFILYHHFSRHLVTQSLLNLFTTVGTATVGIFFFLSGYGIMQQYIFKGSSYLSGFLTKRIKKLLIPLAVSFVFYYTILVLCNIIEPSWILQVFNPRDPFPYHCWYIYASIIFYLFFYLSFRFIKNNDVAMFVLFLASALFSLHPIKNLSETALCFVFGCFIAAKWDKFFIKIPTQFLLFGSLAVAIFSMVFLTSISFKITEASSFFDKLLHLIWEKAYNIPHIAICLFVVCISRYLRLHNRILSVIGNNSLFIYLIHGLVYYVIKSIPPLYQNPVLFFLISLVVSILAGILFKTLYEKIKKRFHKIA